MVGKIVKSNKAMVYKTKGKAKPNKSLTKSVKDIMLKQLETKTKFGTGTEVVINVYGTETIIDVPLAIIQGDQNDMRNGNTIFLTGLSWKASYYNSGEAADACTIIREILLEIDAGIYLNNSFLAAELFDGNPDGATAQTTLDILRKVNREGLKVISNKVFRLEARNGGSKTQKFTNLYHRPMKNIYYRDQVTEQPANVRYAMVVMARQAANDGSLYNVELTYENRIYYKDI